MKKNLIYQLRIDFKLKNLLSHYYDVICVFFLKNKMKCSNRLLKFKKWTSCLIKVLESRDIDFDFHCIWFVITKHVLYYKLANSYIYKPCLENLIASLVMHF